MKQVKCLLGEKGYVWIDTRVGSERVVPLWLFESLLWDISSRSLLASHLALAGSESVFGISQGPPMCVHASLSQDGF